MTLSWSSVLSFITGELELGHRALLALKQAIFPHNSAYSCYEKYGFPLKRVVFCLLFQLAYIPMPWTQAITFLVPCLYNENSSTFYILKPWRWKHLVPLKCLCPPTRQNDVTTEITVTDHLAIPTVSYCVCAAKHVVREKDDIQQAMQFLQQCDLIKIEDILPFFSDFVTIDHFKDAICTSLQVTSNL